MLSRELWCECAEATRRYIHMETELRRMNISFSLSHAGRLADKMLKVLCNGDMEWAEDKIADMNWVVTWCCASPEQIEFQREIKTMEATKFQTIRLERAEHLYDFLKKMTENDWPIE